jgi:SAM-dependent methyltransferase
VLDQEPTEYWARRLGRDFNLRGTGHIEYSESYNRWLYRAKRRALRRALRDLTGGRNALDVGSGTGWCVAQLIEAGFSVEGCDSVPEAVEKLTKAYPAARFFEATLGAEPLPREEATYDLVTAFDVLYHVTDDSSWELALTDLARVLRADGFLVATDTIGDDDRRAASHVRFRSRSTWERAAQSIGLELQQVLPLYRWLSRDRGASRLRRLPDGPRGAIEYTLELLIPREPHMRCIVLSKQAATETGGRTGPVD